MSRQPFPHNENGSEVRFCRGRSPNRHVSQTSVRIEPILVWLDAQPHRELVWSSLSVGLAVVLRFDEVVTVAGSIDKELACPKRITNTVTITTIRTSSE